MAQLHALAEQHVRLLAEHMEITDQITDRRTRCKAYEHYQQQLAKLEHGVEYSPFRWHMLLNHVEIGTDGTITYVFRDEQKFILQTG